MTTMRESRELAVGACQAAARESVEADTHALARPARAAFKAAATAAQQPLSSEACPGTSDLDSTVAKRQEGTARASGVAAARSSLRIHLRFLAAHVPIRPASGRQRLLPGVAAALVEAWAFSVQTLYVQTLLLEFHHAPALVEAWAFSVGVAARAAVRPRLARQAAAPAGGT